MSFWGAVTNVFRNYANFSGRARRSEFWFFYLFNVLVWIGIMIIWPLAILLGPVYSLAVLIPGIAVAVRRLHDTNRSGVYLLVSFVPLVGFILLIIWLTEDSNPAPNAYGYSVEYPGGGPIKPVGGSRVGTLGVKCIAGPLQGHIYPISSSGVMIGRDISCAIRLPENSPGISARHCSVQNVNGSPVITDLGSTYGTFLSDGRKLPPQYPHPVYVGMRFYLGSGYVQFELVTI